MSIFTSTRFWTLALGAASNVLRDHSLPNILQTITGLAVAIVAVRTADKHGVNSGAPAGVEVVQ